MTNWYPATDMPFLPHFSEKSPPRCIKFRACSKRCNFSRAEIALKLQVVYTKIALKIATKIASKTASVNGPLLFSTHFCHLFAVSLYKMQLFTCQLDDNICFAVVRTTTTHQEVSISSLNFHLSLYLLAGIRKHSFVP